jgi:uncharacterized protein (TIGR03083 family)
VGLFVQRFEPVAEHGARFIELVGSLSSVEAARPVPGMEWTVREVAAHVLSVLRRYTTDQRRASTVAGLAARNAEDLAEIPFDTRQIADEAREQLALIGSVAPGIDPATRFQFHAGAEVTASGAWANLIGEFLIHGDDIARATGRSFTVPDADLEGVWRALFPVTGSWLRPEARTIDERYDLGFSFGTVRVHLANGEVIVDDDRDADYVIRCGSAVESTLAFYRRRLITDPSFALLVSRFHDI